MPRLKILITSPAKPGTRHGNRITALRWKGILQQLGHTPRISDCVHDDDDLLVALHARRSASLVSTFKAKRPTQPVVVAITGTDLYRDGKLAATQQTLKMADRLIVLQPAALDELPKRYHAKTSVVLQSVKPLRIERPTRPQQHRVVVAGHLRKVKDPLRAALATRKLPHDSKIVVNHYGGFLDKAIQKQAEREAESNPRYNLHGDIRRSDLRRHLAKCWLMVLSSRMEGGANVLSEAIVQCTPVLASHIAGSVGLLGEDYEGYFEVSNTKQLRDLLLRCENDKAFYGHLAKQVAKRATLFQPAAERNAWKQLLRQIA